jgi:hypothetical protein
MERGMKEPYIEGVAIHDGPSRALAFHEGASEALAGRGNAIRITAVPEVGWWAEGGSGGQ